MSAALRLVVDRDQPRKHPRMKLRDLVTAIRKDGSAALVLLALTGRINERDETVISAVGLAKDTGLSRRTVQTALAKLRSVGAVVEHTVRGKSTVRRVTLDVFDALPRPGESPAQPVAPVKPAALPTRAKDDIEPAQPVAPEVEFQGSGCKNNPPTPLHGPSPAAPPPAAPGRVVGDVEKSPDAPPRKKRVGIRTKREHPPEVHAFVKQFREDFLDNVQADFEFRDPIPPRELDEAAKLMREAPPAVLQAEKEWLMTDDREVSDPKQFPGWKWVIRSVANWRDKREKIRNGMRTAGAL